MIYRKLLTVVIIFVAASAAHAGATDCRAEPGAWGITAEFPRAEAALRSGRGLTVVAIGSSSTLGVGATAPDRSYPAQLARLLRERFLDRAIEVINRGVGGETVAGNLARFDRDVLAAKPDLVIWQVGTNDALLGVPDAQLRDQLRRGIAMLRVAGIDLALLDSQPLARPDWAAGVRRVDAVLQDEARATGTPLLSRHRLMSHWLEAGTFTPASLLGPDGLHMTDASYHCLAERIGDLFPSSPQAGLSDPAAGR